MNAKQKKTISERSKGNPWRTRALLSSRGVDSSEGGDFFSEGDSRVSKEPTASRSTLAKEWRMVSRVW